MIPVFDPAAPAASGYVVTPPLVSVCMTAYNHAPYIGRAIEGVLSQRTTFAVELVLSDDCSTDGTGAICRDYAARYPDRIRLLTGDVNVGMRANYRRTIEACRGRYVAMCDGDDWWCDPLKLQRQVEALEADPSCGICYTRVRCYAQEEGRYVENYPMGAGATTFGELLLNNTIPNCAAVVRRDLLAGYYADPELRPLERPWPLEDYPMWLWMAPRCTIRFLDCETAVFRVLPDSGSHQSSLDRRIVYFDAIFDIKCWFDARYGGGRQRRRIARMRMEYILTLMRDAGGGACLRRWWRDVRREPSLLFVWRGGGKLVWSALRRSARHEFLNGNR